MRITIETCNPTTRDAGGGSGAGGAGSPTAAASAALPQVPQGKYSFIHKVVDGITIVVNTVNVNFVSAAFTASVQMSRIRVESKTPKWANADLRLTRLKDAQKGIILIFKELSWQTVRIEASSTQDKSLTPCACSPITPGVASRSENGCPTVRCSLPAWSSSWTICCGCSLTRS